MKCYEIAMADHHSCLNMCSRENQCESNPGGVRTVKYWVLNLGFLLQSGPSSTVCSGKYLSV